MGKDSRTNSSITRVSKEKIKQILFLEGDNFTANRWGGDWIAQLKGLPKPTAGVVGESWEFSGHRSRPSTVRLGDNATVSLIDLLSHYPNEILGEDVVRLFGAHVPILIKLLDARDNLSLQVHPPDAYAIKNENESGKSEAWVILSVGPGEEDGYVYLGFNQNMQDKKEMFQDMIKNGDQTRILSCLNKIKVKAGDVFPVEPGVIHAVGKGVQLFEIQQSSDLTYRIWDWNRPNKSRPLHIPQAMAVLNFSQTPIPEQKGEVSIRSISGRFGADQINLDSKKTDYEAKTGGRFSVLTCTEGQVSLFFRLGTKDAFTRAGSLKEGWTALIPAHLNEFKMQAFDGHASVIRSFVYLK